MKDKHWFSSGLRNCLLHAFVAIAFLCFHGVAHALNNSAEAIEVALTKAAEEVSDTAKLILEFMKATTSSKGKTWRFVFRDGEVQYTVEMNDKGASKLKKKFDEKQNNPEFWSTFPEPREVEKDIEYLERAKNVIDSFNSTFKAQDRAIIEYHTCNAPKEGKASKYKSGCRDDKSKQWWEVIVQLETESEKSFRKIEFQNGQPVILSRVLVSGNW